MRVLALLALLVTPCGAFFHGVAPGSFLSLRLRAVQLGAQRPFQDVASVGYEAAGRFRLKAKPIRESVTAKGFNSQSTGDGSHGSVHVGHFLHGLTNVTSPLATGEMADPPELKEKPIRATAEGDLNPEKIGNGSLSTARMGSAGGGGPGRWTGGGDLQQSLRGGPARSNHFLPGELTNVIMRCRKAGELEHILHMQRGALNHIHVSAAWVCTARIGGEVSGVVAALQDLTRDLLVQMGGRQIANVMHSMAKLHTSQDATMWEGGDLGLLEALQRRATVTSGEFTPQNVGNVLWALATMGVRADRELLKAMQIRGTATAGEFTPQNLANLLWGLATLAERADRELLEAMKIRGTATAGEFSPQDVSNVLWSLAVMEEGGDGSMCPFIDSLAARVLDLRDQLTVEHKFQLHQWLLSCELDLVSGASLPSGVARVKLEIGEDCLQAFMTRLPHESWFQRDVAANVAALGRGGSKVEIEEEYRDARSGYLIDILVRIQSASGSTVWAVEVDGPTHFLRDGRTPNGSTLLKRKQLGLLGYTVVSVPFWEWDALMGEETRQGYLEYKLLETLGSCVWVGS